METRWLDHDVHLFTVSDVLTPDECAALVDHTEAAGYAEAPITTGRGFFMVPELRNNTRVMEDVPDRAGWLWERIRPFLPKRVHDWHVVGLNERFRYYRYDPGQYFRWHVDGSYVRSPVEQSLLTLMVYLNDGFEGGSNDFAEIGTVAPERGMALLFDHRVLHQGAPVQTGRKYVLRTDVMYRDPLVCVED